MSKFLRLGSVAQLNRASDYGSEGYRFESCRSHTYGKNEQSFTVVRSFLYFVDLPVAGEGSTKSILSESQIIWNENNKACFSVSIFFVCILTAPNF